MDPELFGHRTLADLQLQMQMQHAAMAMPYDDHTAPPTNAPGNAPASSITAPADAELEPEATTDPFPLMRLPIELREIIYSHYFAPEWDERYRDNFGPSGGKHKFHVDLFRVCSTVRYEAQKVWQREHTFVKVLTPWAEVAEHISVQGMVPILQRGVIQRGDRAVHFPYAHAVYSISAPMHGFFADAQNCIVLLLQDLPLFCQVWYYRSLSNTELNSQLTTSLELCDPYRRYSDPNKSVPLALQKSMLMPFGAVKGLQQVSFSGGWDATIVKEVEKKMAESWPSVQECCESAAAFMEEGDAVLAEPSKQNAEAALELYNKAFYAIHVLVHGRLRRVEADHFFHDTISAGHYRGQAATTIRIILRIRLVARTVLAYLHAQQPLEAAFWGMRTVRIMRQALDTEFEEFLGDFVGSGDTGLIYARTAIAVSLLERAGPPDWKENIECREADVDSAELWTLARRSLGGVTRQADRKKVIDEAKAFGVSVKPEVFGEGNGNTGGGGSVADSLTHMDLGYINLAEHIGLHTDEDEDEDEDEEEE